MKQFTMKMENSESSEVKEEVQRNVRLRREEPSPCKASFSF